MSNKLDFATKVRLADWLRENNDRMAGIPLAEGQKLIHDNLGMRASESLLRSMHKDLRLRWPFKARPRSINVTAEQFSDLSADVRTLTERVDLIEALVRQHLSDVGVHNV